MNRRAPLARRTPLKRSAFPQRAPLARRTAEGSAGAGQSTGESAPVVGRSPRRRTPDPITPAVRAEVYARSKGDGEIRLCEARFSARCSVRGEHLHHKLARRHGDHSAENLLDVCLSCHAEIHASKDRKRVERLGLIVRSNQSLIKGISQ